MTGQQYFFALTLPRALQRSLVAWRAEHFPADYGRPLPAAGLMITLAWLGEISEPSVAALQQQAARIRQPAFTLTLNDAGHWPRSGHIWLGSRAAPSGLLQLAALLRSRAARQGCPQPSLPFHPHVRIIHQAFQPVKLPAPGFSWQTRMTDFSLMAIPGSGRRRASRCVARFPLLTDTIP